MKRLLVTALLVMAACYFSGCGEDEWAELKSRCLNTWCKVFERCLPDKPEEAESCRSACGVFDDPGSGEEFKELFLCKEACAKEATPTTECNCLLSKEDGGPDC